jgi:Ser/Thr protein kinase RdoA (MazF antagonist)
MGRPAVSVDSGGLREVLEGVLAPCVHEGRRIRRLHHRPSPFQTSFHLEEVELVLDDGTELNLVWKDLAPGALVEAARGVKPDFLACPAREIAVYQALLAPRRIGPGLRGAVDDPGEGRHWLFLERVVGVELYQMGDLQIWTEVARWLARFHAAFQKEPGLSGMTDQGPLLRYDAQLLRRWMDRARAFAVARPEDALLSLDLAERLRESHDAIIEGILGRPETLVHGEFYPSNVLVNPSEDGLDVVPVDWELAGVGPGLLDLAALVAGGWSEDEKEELALSYRHAFGAAGGLPLETPESFLESLACTRLQLAIQWMGWARDWSPPPEHAQNWRQEAEELLERLGH